MPGEHARLSPTKPEVWRPLFGNEASYSVSSHGRVRSEDRYVKQRVRGGVIVNRFWHGKLLKPKLDKNGYLHIGVKQHHTVCVHRMVAETFIENPLNLPEVNHRDGFEDNNIEENLEWVTTQENAIHAINVLGRVTKGAPGKRIILSDQTEARVFESARAAADWIGCGRSSVHNAVLRNGTCHGYTVTYAR